MKKNKFLLLGVLILTFSLIAAQVSAQVLPAVKIFIEGQELKLSEKDGIPVIINDRTMVPLRAISEGLGMEVGWDPIKRQVLISKPATPVITPGIGQQRVGIMGEPVANSSQLRALLQKNNPNAPDLIDLYLSIGREYGVRGDIAFCQAAKETGWWRYGGLVKPEQNNYCGLWATGSPCTGEENLNGADSNRLWFVEGSHGAYFDSPRTGVEAHIQHLYAYACKAPLPDGKQLVDPRFRLVTRGIAPTWDDLDGRWAVPGQGYGQSILNDYFYKALPTNSISSDPQERILQLERENQSLLIENNNLRQQLQSVSKV